MKSCYGRRTYSYIETGPNSQLSFEPPLNTHRHRFENLSRSVWEPPVLRPYLIVDAEELNRYSVRVVGHVQRDEHRRHYEKASCQLQVRVAKATSLLAMGDLLDLEDL